MRSSQGGDDELVVRHDELMDSILMEEEALVTFHRGRLEEDMEMLRQEMGILGVSVGEGAWETMLLRDIL